MKQTIKIEVPLGKKAVWENNQIKFVDNGHWRNIKTFNDAFKYCDDNNIATNLLLDYKRIPYACSYENNVIQLRIIIAALTNNEKLSLTKGDIWYPIVQFCVPNKKDYCLGNKVIGKIRSNDKEFLVVGSYASYGSVAGLGCVYSDYDLSDANTNVGFIKVSSKEIAEHLSTYFGKLLFDVTYGGCNCDYEWLE